MAGPLSWFRKYQKLMLGVFGVLLMFVFTLSFGSGVDPIIDYLSGGASPSSREDPVLATWNGGKLLSSEAQNMRRNRAMLLQLLANAEMETMQRGGRPQVTGIDRRVNDESMLELKLLAGEAARLGIQVSNNSILNFLEQFSGGTVQAGEYLDMWRQLTGNGEASLLSILRTELAAQKMRSMAWSGARATSPVRYWDHYNQLERFVSIEYMPLPVEEFVDQVPEPKESELQAFYDEYKDRYPQEGSSEPGFKRRMRRAFDYVKLNYNLFLTSEMENITNEQIQTYYDENKDDFREMLPESDLELGNEDDELEEDTVEESNGETGEDTAVSNEADSNESEATMADEPSESLDEAPADSETESITKEPADAESDADRTNDTDVASEPADDTSTSEPPAEPSDENPGVSFTPLPQQESAEETPSETPASEPTSDESTEAAETSADDSSSAPQSSADSDSTETEPVAEIETMDEADAPADSTATATDSADAETSDVGDSETKEVKYRSVEDVADTIKERLAAEPARKKFQNVMSQIQTEMDRFYRKQVFYEMKKKKKGLEKPEMPDLGKIDSPVPINVQTMPLADRVESAAYELGQAYDLEFSSQNIQKVPFAQFGYGDNLPVYQPSVFPGGEAMTKFVYWVTAEEPAYMPELAEIRDEVVRAWKLDQARTLALAKAEEMATKANAAQTPLSDSLAGENREFATADDLAWFTGGSVGLQAGGLPRPTSIQGIEYPGADLLKTIFRLKEGEVGYAMDAPEQACYVVRLVSESPSQDERQQQFLSDGINNQTVGFLAYTDNRRVLGDWYRGLQESFDVTWNEDPASQERR